MLFSAAGREEGRGWLGVEEGRRKGQVGVVDGGELPCPGPSPTSHLVETVETEAGLAVADRGGRSGDVWVWVPVLVARGK